MYLAVAAHVAAERATLLLVLPELRELDALARDARAVPAFAQALAAGRWPTPPAAELDRVKAAVAAALKAEAASQHKARVAFVAIFRRSCLVAFALAVCTKVGAADRARASERAVERAAFFRKLGRSALLYVGIAVAMRLVPKALDGTLGEVWWGHPAGSTTGGARAAAASSTTAGRLTTRAIAQTPAIFASSASCFLAIMNCYRGTWVRRGAEGWRAAGTRPRRRRREASPA